MKKRYGYIVGCFILLGGLAASSYAVTPGGGGSRIKNLGNLSKIKTPSSAELTRSVQMGTQLTLPFNDCSRALNSASVKRVSQARQGVGSVRSSLEQSSLVLPSAVASRVSALAAPALTSSASAHPYLSGVFQAWNEEGASRYSGTLFEVDGRIWGVVAAHVFGEGEQNIDILGRYFWADVYNDGTFTSVPARAVLISPLFDVALVAFDSKIVPLAKPFTLDFGEVTLGQDLSSCGFIGMQQPVEVNNRRVVELTPLSFRTTMPIAQSFRRGLCGSAIIKEGWKLSGVHIGSTRKPNEQEDIGYGVPASALYKMVQNYAKPGSQMFELDFDGHKIYVGPDEYLSRLTLLDADERPLWEGWSHSYFSYKTLRTKVKELSPRYVQFTIGRVDITLPQLKYEPVVRTVRYEISENDTEENHIP